MELGDIFGVRFEGERNFGSLLMTGVLIAMVGLLYSVLNVSYEKSVDL